jgi:hypothetical protein
MKLQRLSEDEKKKLKEYIESLKEINKEVNKLLEKAGVKLAKDKTNIEEEGGNMSSDLHLSI